ncbi:signal peptidase I [Aristaeella lactis]|uniref:Signal peptidase I n=1 Tax=Aristaeella lactis TaxID=3046383 RepID=A0AC61PQU7_9FIRM|nr:signal peptidase I [Aristaeella lactis]QUA54157.1 signal peptidase I [Aristaeella lactis]SMC93781.1 signal peptidase I [Aristaeella lactis]
MARKTRKADKLPELNEIETEMSQVRSKGKFRQALKGTFGTFVIVAALAVIIAFIFLPVLRITNGHNMEPGLQPGDIVVLVKTDDVKTGDVCGFYFNNKLLLRRVIAGEGDKVEIDEKGYVKVNGEFLEEDGYISEHALGQCDIDFPFRVPAGQFFVMGDNRDFAFDSRATNFGCVSQEEIYGKPMARIYPFDRLTWFGF